ncbi:hypothetical protein [Pectinatus frisingensis]|uniref:hypothetical protein n=1 Tax=Pectinatus frisingensis TaxID=865 RepID=UPI0018C5658E|nr:hypothetical protein [Pectinatus frisingensis]
MINIPDAVATPIYFIAVPILAVIGTYCYMNSHSVISTGPEGEAKGCFSVFISFLIGAGILVTLIMAVFAWVIGFIIAHWIWFVVGAAIIVGLIIIGSKDSPQEKAPAAAEKENDDSNDQQ